MKQVGDKILVSSVKAQRAVEIGALLDRTPKNDDEVELRAKFSKMIADAEVSGDDAIVFVYEKLGGLTRTLEEEKENKKKVEEIKKRRKIQQ